MILQAIGTGKITTKPAVSPQHTACFTYAIHNRQAISLLAQIQRYLRTYRAQRGALILRDYIALTPRNGKYSEESLSRRLKFEQAVPNTRPGMFISTESAPV